ncbi:phage integrase family protein [Burkholderia sp. Bp9142]|uniref:phage integrase family protein n=1 Tax=Burkholderia sp. Bp9142 TaxID=2184573 RepID=UPI000F5B00F1|nr:phage integrase family protein [Burkholderia sp. Bp9142]RQR27299.1 hypothetical protein DIE22_30965 [Burkholderia sp. Bp9142]
MQRRWSPRSMGCAIRRSPRPAESAHRCLPPRTARALASGVDLCADLLVRIAHRPGWWRPIPGLGRQGGHTTSEPSSRRTPTRPRRAAALMPYEAARPS